MDSFYFFLSVLEFEFRAFHLLGSCSTTWDTPPAIFALVISEMWSCFLARQSRTMNFLFYTSPCNWDYKHIPLCPALFCWNGILQILPRLESNCGPPDLSLPSSKNYRYEPPAPKCFWCQHFYCSIENLDVDYISGELTALHFQLQAWACDKSLANQHLPFL
jgi:hypothetical protein